MAFKQAWVIICVFIFYSCMFVSFFKTFYGSGKFELFYYSVFFICILLLVRHLCCFYAFSLTFIVDHFMLFLKWFRKKMVWHGIMDQKLRRVFLKPYWIYAMSLKHFWRIKEVLVNQVEDKFLQYVFRCNVPCPSFHIDIHHLNRILIVYPFKYGCNILCTHTRDHSLDECKRPDILAQWGLEWEEDYWSQLASIVMEYEDTP